MNTTEHNNKVEKLKTKKNEFNRNPVLLIGIGIFSWLAIMTFASLFKNTLKDIFFNINISQIVIIWTTEIGSLLVYVLGFLFLIKIIKNNLKKDITLFRNASLLLVLGLILQISEQFVNGMLRNENNFENEKKYVDFFKDNIFYSLLIQIGFVFFTYLVVGILIYKKRK